MRSLKSRGSSSRENIFGSTPSGATDDNSIGHSLVLSFENGAIIIAHILSMLSGRISRSRTKALKVEPSAARHSSYLRAFAAHVARGIIEPVMINQHFSD